MNITSSVPDNSAKVGLFDFESHTVTINRGYKMPINGLGTYSLYGDECKNSVRTALESGVQLIDTASAYGNEEEIGQAISKAIDDGIVKREDIFCLLVANKNRVLTYDQIYENVRSDLFIKK